MHDESEGGILKKYWLEDNEIDYFINNKHK